VALIVPPFPTARRRTTVSPRPLPGWLPALASRVKGLSMARQFLVGEAGAPVSHLDLEVLSSMIGRDDDLDRLAPIRVFGAVFQQVPGHLIEGVWR
jgi:hypothetical protein